MSYPDSVSSGYWSPVHDSASGSSAPSTSLTIGPWWVTVTSIASVADRPFTWISSRTTSASRQPPSNSYIRASSAFSRSTNRSWVSAITFVKPYATCSVWPNTGNGFVGRVAPRTR